MRRKKTIFAMCLVLVLAFALAACGGNANSGDKAEETKDVTIKSSPDKYTFYMKNYVGRNLASVGYTSMGGDRLDAYGDGYISLAFLSPEGEYINIDKDESLKQYKVVGQNVKPNTEIKYAFDEDDDGEDYNFVSWQNISEIELTVAKAIGFSGNDKKLTNIKASPDESTFYVKNYVGRNLTMCGYVSMGGDLTDAYGDAYVKLTPNTSTGEYIDVEKKSVLKQYVVVKQSVKPNAEIKLEHDDYGFVDYQTYDEIVLDVEKVQK